MVGARLVLSKYGMPKRQPKSIRLEKEETTDEHENDKSNDKTHNDCIIVIKIVIVSHSHPADDYI